MQQPQDLIDDGLYKAIAIARQHVLKVPSLELQSSPHHPLMPRGANGSWRLSMIHSGAAALLGSHSGTLWSPWARRQSANSVAFTTQALHPQPHREVSLALVAQACGIVQP